MNYDPISSTYSECVLEALVIQHANHIFSALHCVVFCGNIFFHTLSRKQHDFRGKNYREQNAYFDSLWKFRLKYLSYTKKKSARLCHKSS